MTFDREKTAGKLATAIEGSLQIFKDGFEGDLNTFATAISEDIVKVMMLPEGENKERSKAELMAQVRGLAEIQRIRVSREGWNILRVAVNVAVGTISAVVAGAVPPGQPGLFGDNT